MKVLVSFENECVELKSLEGCEEPGWGGIDYDDDGGDCRRIWQGFCGVSLVCLFLE